MFVKKLISLFVFILFLQFVQGQESVMKANAAYNRGDYRKALELFKKETTVNSDPDLLERRGTCYLKINKLEEAIWDFTKSKKLGNNSPSLFLKMAETKQHQADYEQATFFYKSFIKMVDESHKDYNLAYRELKNCTKSAFYNEDAAVALVQSFGELVNTPYDELFPIQSPKLGNVFYYSSNRNLKDFEVFSSSIKDNGDWMNDEEFGKSLNSPSHELAQDITGDGTAFLYHQSYREGNKSSTIFSTFNDQGENVEIVLPDDILVDAIDLQIIDHNTIAFASDKLKGFGGYDIFTINYQNEQWEDPQNEGPEINTIYDERSPFFSRDKKFVYFSSNKPYCFGGYDIYLLDKNEKDAKPNNIGKPINSAGHDLGFKIDQEGHMGVFSSNRKSGEGGFDIYFAYMQDIKTLAIRDTTEFEFITDYFDIKKEEEAMALLEKEKQSMMEKDTIQKEVAEIPIVEEEPKEDIIEEESIKEEEIVVQEKVIQTEETIITQKPELKTEEEQLKKIESPQKELTTAEPEIPEAKLEEIKDYTIYYQDRQDLLNEENRTKIKALSIFLEKEKTHKVCLIAHTDYLEPGLPEFVQYNTLKRAKTIAERLVEEGIEADRISIESVAANYPVVRNEVAGKEYEDHLYLNKRIDLQISNAKGAIVKDHTVKVEDIPAFALDRRFELYQSIREELYYSVQIAETERIFKNAILRLYSDIYVRKDAPASNNKYYIGMYTKFEDAKKLKEDLMTSSAPMFKIVAFYNGKEISKSDIEALTVEYPDLKDYKSDLE